MANDKSRTRSEKPEPDGKARKDAAAKLRAERLNQKNSNPPPSKKSFPNKGPKKKR